MRGAPGCLHGFPCSGLPRRAGVCHQGLYVSTSRLLCPGPGPAALTLSSAAHRAQADGRGRVGHPSRGDGEGARPPLRVHRDSRPVSHCPCGHLKSMTRLVFWGSRDSAPDRRLRTTHIYVLASRRPDPVHPAWRAIPPGGSQQSVRCQCPGGPRGPPLHSTFPWPLILPLCLLAVSLTGTLVMDLGPTPIHGGLTYRSFA